MKKEVKKQTKRGLKRETKMAIFTYGCIATIYMGILYIFSIFLFPTIFKISKILDIKTIALMIFVFVASIIGMYKGTKGIKSNYIRGLAIFAVPTIIVLVFKDTIAIPVLLMLGYFMINGIYKVTPKVNKIWMKILKFLLVLVVTVIVLISVGELIGLIGGSGLISSTTDFIFGKLGIASLETILSKNIALIIAALLFMSFTTKEIIKEVINNYKPTDREIGSLISGTVVLLFVMIALTSVIQFKYQYNMQESRGYISNNLYNNDVNIVAESSANTQNAMYDIAVGLFSLFMLIEIYEEVRIVQMLKPKEE